jgi:hypothetical protein
MQISENSAAITFQANSGCYFSSITANGEEQYYSGSTQVVLYVTEGMVINVTSGKINRDQNLVVYVNDKLDIASMQYFSLTYSDRSSMGVTNGYNTVNFYSGDLPIYFSSYGSESDLVYLNDEVVDPMYSGSSSRQINEVPNNSVLKIFFNETPETYTVTVDADENLTVSATKDLISEVADCSSFTVLGTSNVSIAVSGADNEDKLVVKVNDQEVTAEDGKYSFTVSADTKVSVSKEAGVSNISVDNNASSEVYNLQGIRVARNANNINNLPAGIYIMNGKKVVIK